MTDSRTTMLDNFKLFVKQSEALQLHLKKTINLLDSDTKFCEKCWQQLSKDKKHEC